MCKPEEAVCIAGPKGERGADGRDGIPGIGQPGANGLNGRDGKDGIPGRDGERGLTGPGGIPGTPGGKGSAGKQGPRGIKGVKGEIGEKGGKGDKGERGEEGVSGHQGVAGLRGEKGDKGGRGDQGYTGYKGGKGEKGEMGLRGGKGMTGEKGNQGGKGERQTLIGHLPVPCHHGNYRVLNDTWRKPTVHHSSSGRHCDYQGNRLSFGFQPGWHAFSFAIGGAMPETCPPRYHCGTGVPGWLKGSHPSITGQKVSRTVCFHWSSGCCQWQTAVEVINCGLYYVYNLPNTPGPNYCDFAYCAGGI